MIKKCILFLSLIFINSTVIQASWSEKMSNIGSEIGKKIVSHPYLSLAVGSMIAHILPFYYTRQLNKSITEHNKLQQRQIGKEMSDEQRRSKLSLLLEQKRYYEQKYKLFSNIATKTLYLPFALGLYQIGKTIWNAEKVRVLPISSARVKFE